LRGGRRGDIISVNTSAFPEAGGGRKGRREEMEEPRLWSLLRELKSPSYEWVDLTHAFDDESPRWQGFPAMESRAVYDYDNAIFRAHVYSLVGQYGTHVDAPVHFYEQGRTLDQIGVREMVFPLCVVDVHKKVEKNCDYALSRKDLEEWESRHGRIPEGAFVAMRSDWHKRWPDSEACMNFDSAGNVHYPGWSLEALRFLVEERGVGAVGHEAFDTDPPALEEQAPLQGEYYVLSHDRIQVEVMANLDKVPEVGAVIFCAFPKAKGGAGFPARCFAVFPKE
jgi:kynurenine formamidase